MKALLFTCSIAAVIFLTGCTFDYEEARMAEDLSETVPETVLHEFTQVRMYKGVPQYRVYGSKAETYGKKKETVAEDVLFQEFDDEGQVVTEGSADRITYFTESENAELTGNLDFYSADEEAGIEGEYLYWNDEKQTLAGRPEERISMEKNDGSAISGRGFTAEISEKAIRFSDAVEGVWVDEEEEDEEDGESND